MRALTLVFVVLAAPAALAQPVTPEAACSYTECALRIEPRFFRGDVIVRGEPGAEEDLGTVGLLGGGLADAVAEVPEALAYAEDAASDRLGGFIATFVAVGALTYSSTRIGDKPEGLEIAAFTGAVAASVVGVVLTLGSQRKQAKAVWEYNRAVAGE